MKSNLRHAAVPALLALAFATTSAWAQTPATATAASSSATSHAQRHADYVEKRIDELHAELKITPQQSQQWDAFAQVMRDNAHNTDQAFHDRAQKLPSENADDAMKSYAQLAQLHADNMQKLSSAFSALYATLSDEQKAIADPLFRNQHAKRPGPVHHHQRAPATGGASAPSAASN